MGNAISPYYCCYVGAAGASAKLVFWEGTTRLISGKCLAGEIMFQFPDRIVCHADSFYIGHRVPALGIYDDLVRGQTYFVLPVDHFAGEVLSSKSIVALAAAHSNHKVSNPINFGNNPFQYEKAANGRMLVKVSPEFIMRIIAGAKAEDQEGRVDSNNGASTSPLCSTPELQKHYEMLVGSKEQVWSPKLETITEMNMKRTRQLSPYRLLGLDWRSEKMTA